MQKYVFAFDNPMKGGADLLGGKGANLAEMTQIGIPVPPGFTVTTDACRLFLGVSEHEMMDRVWPEVMASLRELEEKMGKKLGDAENPLLVSVRSGGVVSMPGMMDTILNLGLNDVTCEGLAKKASNPRFAFDCYRRFMQMFGNVVYGIDHHFFEEILEAKKAAKHYGSDTEFLAEDWQAVIGDYKNLVREKCGREFPQDVYQQLEEAMLAVFRSWNNERARAYRRIYDIPDDQGTGVNVQSMVFGNLGETSGTGVLFTRNPSTGEKKLFGEYLMNAQGEDVVAGIRTPMNIHAMAEKNPKIFGEILAVCERLESHFGDMQDIEFTIEEDALFLLQTRRGKRSGAADLAIAVDLVEEGVIDREKALLNLEAQNIDQVLHPQISEDFGEEPITKGLPASPGAGVGKIYFDADSAIAAKKLGEKVILVRRETSPEDVQGMHIADGILTACGGMTSHAAVVARGLGTPCVSGAEEISIVGKKLMIGNIILEEGNFVSINGSTGDVFVGEAPLDEAGGNEILEEVLDWTKDLGAMHVRTNADTPDDCRKAISFGAEGIGLCRTEHMFFGKDRLPVMRQMILSESDEERASYLEKLEDFQREDFEGIFEAMDGLPVNIRLLDPPLHEFLPHTDVEIEEVCKNSGKSREKVLVILKNLEEENPMLGHRGCRLMISYPEVARMQARAILAAAMACMDRGIEVHPEIMIPLVSVSDELAYLREIVEDEAEVLQEKHGKNIPYQVGTMIETPRACVTAEEVVKYADYFSFGTNDLTQMSFGFSRDDAGKFLSDYQRENILKKDPFQVLDQRGVGALIRQAVSGGRSENPQIKLGICGEHGGEASSIDFCFRQGFNYVSCSPFRVPGARVAVAQSFLRKKMAE